MEDFRDFVLPRVPSSGQISREGVGATHLRPAWEPALSDMLADPITQMLMRRDGVQEGEVHRLAERLRQARQRV